MSYLVKSHSVVVVTFDKISYFLKRFATRICIANLIESVTLENSSETNVWKPIPFPKGFNADNCDFFVSSLGNSPTSNVIFKISLDKTRFTAFEFNGNKSHVVHFTFIKIK